MDQLRDDLLEFIERAIDGLSAILEDLGDELANRRPDLPGANSCFAILTHCLGVMEYWGGEVIAGRSIVRDRPAEFLATWPIWWSEPAGPKLSCASTWPVATSETP